MPKGKSARLTVYVDANHVHDLVPCQSVTGIAVIANNMPLFGVIKRQKTVKSSMCGLELDAEWIATEMIFDLCYMLRMIGVLLDKPALILRR